MGEMSVIADKKMNQKYDPRKYNLSLEYSFLIRRKDLLELFNKFYMVPAKHPLSSNQVYHTYAYDNTQSHQIRFKVTEDGPCTIKVEVPDDSRYEEGPGKVRYPTIKYFLAKERDADAPKRSVLKSRLELKSRINMEE